MDFGFQVRVDEDEGSPLQNGVKDANGVRKSRDQRKPSGYAITRQSFPPGKALKTRTASDRGVKTQGVAKIWAV